MPDRHSRPARPSATLRATMASQSSPAATVSTPGPPSRLTPRVATWITVPSKPSSETTRLLPPPRISTGSPVASADRTASMSSSSVPARTKPRAGPPRRSVVKSASLIGTASREADDGAGARQHLRIAGPGGDVDRHLVAVELAGDDARDLDLGALVVVGHDDRGGEPDAELGHRGRVPGPFGEVPACQGHREHAVRDHVGKADGRGDPLVPVDGVEVAGSARVPDQVRPGHLVLPRRDLGALVHVVETGARHLLPYAPRSTRVDRAVQTCSPSAVRISVTVAIVVMVRICLIDSMVDCATTTSPACSGREWVKLCSPCTTIA